MLPHCLQFEIGADSVTDHFELLVLRTQCKASLPPIALSATAMVIPHQGGDYDGDEMSVLMVEETGVP